MSSALSPHPRGCWAATLTCNKQLLISKLNKHCNHHQTSDINLSKLSFSILPPPLKDVLEEVLEDVVEDVDLKGS